MASTPGVPIRTGASFVGLGTHRHRVVFYPISEPDPVTGLATINWIAEITVDNSRRLGDRRLEPAGGRSTVVHPSLSRTGTTTGWTFRPCCAAPTQMFEYPMIDRDPVPTWVDGHVALLGDAAHVMYPTGSNGASQAIMDARVLGAAMLEHGVTAAALQAYDARLCAEISAVVLRNRGAGPFGLLNLLDERCGGVFDDIDAVIPAAERDAFMSRYKAAAGFAMETLNERPADHPARRTGAPCSDAMLRALRLPEVSRGNERRARRRPSASACWPFATRSTRFGVSRSAATNCTMPAAGTWC